MDQFNVGEFYIFEDKDFIVCVTPSTEHTSFDEFAGVVVASKYAPHPVGYMADTWYKFAFKKVSGNMWSLLE